MFKKSLAIIFIVIALCFSFAACGSDTKLLEARIAELEQQLEAAQGIQGPKGDKGDKGDGITVLTEPLALGTTVNVLDSAGLVLFTVKVEETDTHWVVTVTNVNVYGRFNARNFIFVSYYCPNDYNTFPSFPDVFTTPGSSATTSMTKNDFATYISIRNKLTEIPYAVYQC